MKKVILTRHYESKYGTEGVLVAPNGLSCFTIEPPWHDNQPNISCIPPGEYKVVPFSGRRFKKVYHVLDVPNRSYILIHAGNLAGDRTLGLKSNTYGCILPGIKRGYLYRQRAVLLSRYAINKLKESLDYEPFVLQIISLVR